MSQCRGRRRGGTNDLKRCYVKPLNNAETISATEAYFRAIAASLAAPRPCQGEGRVLTPSPAASSRVRSDRPDPIDDSLRRLLCEETRDDSRSPPLSFALPVSHRARNKIMESNRTERKHKRGRPTRRRELSSGQKERAIHRWSGPRPNEHRRLLPAPGLDDAERPRE